MNEDKLAMITVTVISATNTFAARIETSTDLPPDPIGEVVVTALQKAWKAGDDPTKCVVVIRFD